MELDITPEPTEEERAAIAAAMAALDGEANGSTPWWLAGLPGDDEPDGV